MKAHPNSVPPGGHLRPVSLRRVTNIHVSPFVVCPDCNRFFNPHGHPLNSAQELSAKCFKLAEQMILLALELDPSERSLS